MTFTEVGPGVASISSTLGPTIEFCVLSDGTVTRRYPGSIAEVIPAEQLAMLLRGDDQLGRWLRAENAGGPSTDGFLF